MEKHGMISSHVTQTSRLFEIDTIIDPVQWALVFYILVPLIQCQWLCVSRIRCSGFSCFAADQTQGEQLIGLTTWLI